MRSQVSLVALLLGLFFGTAFAQEPPPDSDPVLLGKASYAMPQEAIDAEIDGDVGVAIHIDENGKPTRAIVYYGPIWPCGSYPMKALDKLFSTLSDTFMTLRFSPAIEKGKPVARNIGMTLNLKNPKLSTPPAPVDPATGKPMANKIQGGVLNGKALRLLKPAYPSEARSNRDSGTVSVRVLINEEGKVVRAGPISGARSLQFASRDAACDSKFSPTLLEGKPVKVSGVITYNFVP